MKKLSIIISLILLSLTIPDGTTYANTDYVRSNQMIYTCNATTGIGILQIRFGGQLSNGQYINLHSEDVRYYQINHAGYVTIRNPLSYQVNPAQGDFLRGFYIAGCTRSNQCSTTTPLAGPTQIAPFNGSHTSFPNWRNDPSHPLHNLPLSCIKPYQYTRNGANWLNYWPVNSGQSSQESFRGLTQMVDAVLPNDTRGTINCGGGGSSFRQRADGAIFQAATTIVTFIPGDYGGIPNTPLCRQSSCDPSVANTRLRTTQLDAGGARCSEGTSANFSASTDVTGKTTYAWTCQKTGGSPVSCNAYYKPICVPTSTNACCDERKLSNDPTNTTQFGHPPRLPDQCRYSVISSQSAIGMTGGILSTQSGSTVVALTGSYLRSTNGITGNCQAPVDGKPRIVCDADPFVNITGTISSFTLPSSVTQRVGSCRVIFDAADVCRPRTDTIQTRAVVVNCDSTITDENNPRYCPTSVTGTETGTDNVCVRLNDRFGNPVLGYSTGRIVSRFSGSTLINSYFEKYNSGSDTTRYSEGSYTEVNGDYCTPRVCTIVNGVLCGTGCPGEGTPTCNPPPPTPCDPNITDPNDSRFCPRVCVNTPEEPNKCPTDPICIPTEANNYCKPPYIHVPPTTVPGCDSPDYAGDPLLCIQREKACTAHLEVLDSQGSWTAEGDAIIYDEAMTYRIVVDGTDPVCRNGTISFRDPNPVTATGGTFSGSITWSSSGTFTATVIRDSSATPLTARGPVVRAVYTQPGGISYGLTARADDFEDTPLTITGERMKGVRIIGAAGTSITSFNLNNAGVIGEDSSSNTVTMRNAILKNVGLLTRSVEPNGVSSINGVYYAEGDVSYTQLIGSVSNGFRTVIVRGNLTIDTSIPPANTTNPIMGIIVVKRADGTGGNIVVRNDVTSMRALIFAEGSFYGETQSFGNVPLTKLLLKGTLFSRNTVGGSADIGNLYISGGASASSPEEAFLQDLNNVRNGYGCPLGGPQCYKNYPDPFIIEYENTQSDPPPGFTL